MAETPSNIKERILQIAKHKGITYETFFDDLGMSYGNFKGRAKNSPLNSDSIAHILSKYTDINPGWLITGKGNMFNNTLHEVTNQDSHQVEASNNSSDDMIHEGPPRYRRKPSYESLKEENKKLKEEYEKLLMKYTLLQNDLDHSNTQIELLKNINEEKERTIAFLTPPKK